MLKKIIYSCFAVYFVLSIIGGAILQSRLEHYRQQSEYYRIEYERASDQQQLLAGTVDKCWESTERTKELLGSSVSSIGVLRNQLKEVRKNYENMEVLLLDCYDNLHNRNNNTNLEEIKENVQ